MPFNSISKKTYRLLFLFFFLSLCFPTYAEKILPKEIELLANKHNIPIDSLSIIIQPVNSETRLINLNSTVNRTPASVAKLFTAYVAIDHLGPEFHWTTKVFTTDSINDGEVDSLIFEGGGDPYISIERLEEMVAELRNLGINTINKGLIVDQNYFKQPQISTAVFDDDPLRPYNIMHTSFLINSNKIDFKIKKKSNNKIQIHSEFIPDGVSFKTDLVLGPGSCSNVRSNLQFTENAKINSTDKSILVQGEYPINCKEFEHDISLTDANHYFIGAFKKLWIESGGSFNGYISEAKTGLYKRLIISFDSLRLDEVIIKGIKDSDNLIARNLFLSLNQSFGGKNYRASRRIMKKALINNGVVIPKGTFFENGSGLSRNTKISPETILSLLQAIKKHSSHQILLDALPVSGVDGTLENKYRTNLLRSRLNLKTGTLDGVSGLAGFITGLSGKEYLFIFLHNDIPDHSYKISLFREDLLNWAVSDI